MSEPAGRGAAWTEERGTSDEGRRRLKRAPQASGETLSEPGGRADTAYLLDASGPAAPPRDNGELMFAAPWESQAFGLALALHEAGRFDWEDFRQQLIAEIGAWEAGHAAGDDGWSYYTCWLSALENLVSERGLVGGGDLSARAAMLAARLPDHGPAGHGPAGHRHDHPHDTAPPGATHAG